MSSAGNIPTNWDGISINWGGQDLLIISPIAVNEWGLKVRYWLSGVTYFLFFAYLVRRAVGKIVKGTDGGD